MAPPNYAPPDLVLAPFQIAFVPVAELGPNFLAICLRDHTSNADDGELPCVSVGVLSFNRPAPDEYQPCFVPCPLRLPQGTGLPLWFMQQVTEKLEELAAVHPAILKFAAHEKIGQTWIKPSAIEAGAQAAARLLTRRDPEQDLEALHAAASALDLTDAAMRDLAEDCLRQENLARSLNGLPPLVQNHPHLAPAVGQ